MQFPRVLYLLDLIYLSKNLEAARIINRRLTTIGRLKILTTCILCKGVGRTPYELLKYTEEREGERERERESVWNFLAPRARDPRENTKVLYLGLGKGRANV